MEHRKIQKMIDNPTVKHQHGHRHQVIWYWSSFKTRNHWACKDDTKNNDMSKNIYCFKNQSKWSIENQHKIRIKKRRAVARDTKQYMNNYIMIH